MKNTITILALAMVVFAAGCASCKTEPQDQQTKPGEVVAAPDTKTDDSAKEPEPKEPIRMNPPPDVEPTPRDDSRPDDKPKPKQSDEVQIVGKVERDWDAIRALRISHKMMLAAADAFVDSNANNDEAFAHALKFQYAVDRNLTKVLTYYSNNNAAERDCRIIYDLVNAQELLTARTKEIAEHWNMLSEEEKKQADNITLFDKLRTARSAKQEALAEILKGINDAIDKQFEDN